MKIFKVISFIFLLFSFISLQAQQTNKAVNDTIPIYNFQQFEPLLYPASADSIYIFNFWATYCAPCIKEIPYFEQVGKAYASQKVKIILVSLDLKSQVTSRVIPFIKRQKINSEVILLNDPDANAWIDKVNPSWDGAIPATLIVKGDRREFFEKSFTKDELEQVVTKFLQ